MSFPPLKWLGRSKLNPFSRQDGEADSQFKASGEVFGRSKEQINIDGQHGRVSGSAQGRKVSEFADVKTGSASNVIQHRDKIPEIRHSVNPSAQRVGQGFTSMQNETTASRPSLSHQPRANSTSSTTQTHPTQLMPPQSDFNSNPPGSWDATPKQTREDIFQHSLRLLEKSRQKVDRLRRVNQVLQNELQKEQKNFQGSEKRFQSLLDQANQQIQDLRRAGMSWKNKAQTHEQEIGRMEIETQTLMKNLEECKDRIFDAQPVQGMTDTELRSMYTRLCNRLEYWVDEHFDDIDSPGSMRALRLPPDDESDLSLQYFSQREFDAVRAQPELSIMFLVTLVTRHLQYCLLGPARIFPGMDKLTESWLHDIVNGIGELRPEQGVEGLQNLRVDMYRALSTSAFAQTMREDRLKAIGNTILRCFGKLRSRKHQNNAESTELCKIVEEAAGFATGVRESSATYDFDGEILGKKTMLEAKDMKKYNVIDSRTGCPIRPSTALNIGEEGTVGEIILVVHPAFVRKSTMVAEEIVLVKQTVVVKFNEDATRAGNPK